MWLVKVAQSCPTLCNPMDYTVHGILQARILEWVAFPFSRVSSQTQWNSGFPHCRQILYQLSHQGSPYMWLSKSLTLSELLIISFLSPIVLTVDISQVSLQLSPVTSSVIIVLQRSWWEDHELSVVLISKSQIWSLLTILTVTTLFQGMFTFCFIYS